MSSESSQKTSKNSLISGPFQGETPHKQAENLPSWVSGYINRKSSPSPLPALKGGRETFTINTFSFIRNHQHASGRPCPPLSVVVRSVPVSLMLSAPFLEVVIVPIFIMKQVPVPPAAFPGPAYFDLSRDRCLFLLERLVPDSLRRPTHSFQNHQLFQCLLPFVKPLFYYSIMGPLSEDVSSLRTSLLKKSKNKFVETY